MKKVKCPYCQTELDAWDIIETETGKRMAENNETYEGECKKCKKPILLYSEVEFTFSLEKLDL